MDAATSEKLPPVKQAPTAGLPKRPQSVRRQFLSVLAMQMTRNHVDPDAAVLVIGGSDDDVNALLRAGFRNITVSNLGSSDTVSNLGSSDGEGIEPESNYRYRTLAIDAEDIRLPDFSYDLVVAHAVLHHCRSPHKALCEMVRVAKKHAIILEPNDSILMDLLVRLRLSFPYELPAVQDHGCVAGGVRYTQVPNFIYRWNAKEVFKTVSSCIPEYIFSSTPYAYWDFEVDEYGLSLRTQTRIGAIVRLIGAANLLTCLHLVQVIMNKIPFLRRRGNKFFCCINKHQVLRPWLAWGGENIVFDPSFNCRTR